MGTQEHRQVAEHMLVLYLERGDLTATVMYELAEGGKPPLTGFKLKTWVKPHFKMGRHDRTAHARHMGSANFSVSASTLNAPSASQSTHLLRGGTHSHHERSVEGRDRTDRSAARRGFWKKTKNSKG